jgi:hypothetical protein
MVVTVVAVSAVVVAGKWLISRGPKRRAATIVSLPRKPALVLSMQKGTPSGVPLDLWACSRSASIAVLRKLLAILLLAVFAAPLASSLFALMPRSEASLPACCRRAGMHHCTQMAEQDSQPTDHRHVSVVQEKCPCCPAVLSLGSVTTLLASPSAPLLLTMLQGQSAIVAQAEVSQRIAHDRARGKRGPPSFLTR